MRNYRKIGKAVSGILVHFRGVMIPFFAGIGIIYIRFWNRFQYSKKIYFCWNRNWNRNQNILTMMKIRFRLRFRSLSHNTSSTFFFEKCFKNSFMNSWFFSIIHQGPYGVSTCWVESIAKVVSEWMRISSGNEFSGWIKKWLFQKKQ